MSLRKAFLWLLLAGASCPFTPQVSANPHPPLPASAIPHADAGQQIFTNKCASCHQGGASTNPFDLLTGTSPYMFTMFTNYASAQAAGIKPEMYDNLKSLSSQQMDDLSVYLSGQDQAWYTIKGTVTHPGNPALPVENATVTLTTDYLMGQGFYFPAQTTTTDSQGKYSFQTWAGRKVLTVSKAGMLFSPNKLAGIGLDCDIPQYGTYTQGNLQVTASDGPDGPMLSGEDFQAMQLVVRKYPQVSPHLPWVFVSPSQHP